MGKEKIIEVSNLSKIYQMGELPFKALKNIDLYIKDGEFAVILGPSGSGKSTLLNSLGGMDKPTTGEIIVRGKDISGYNNRLLTEYRRDEIGFVFQFYNLLSDLTVKENVELAVEICKNPLDIDEILNNLGLGDKKNNFPSQLSGGEQQRVSIARAVAKNPAILLCDEPTGALDYETGIKILKVLTEINKKFRKTIVVITHNSSIGRIADRIIYLKSGEIIDVIENKSPKSVDELEW